MLKWLNGRIYILYRLIYAFLMCIFAEKYLYYEKPNRSSNHKYLYLK